MQSKWKTALFSAGIPLVLLAALIGFVVFALGQVGKAGETVIDVKAENYVLQNETAQPGQTVFLGDSITEYYPLGEFYAAYQRQTGINVYNRGISAENTAHLLGRLETTLFPLAPKNVVLLIGTNDIGQNVNADAIYQNIQTIIERILQACPQTNLILQALYPVNENMPDFYNRYSVGSRTNEKIRSLNQRLKALAEEKQLVFLDLTADLCDDTGNFSLEYTYDGLHPSAAGYRVITKRILPLLLS